MFDVIQVKCECGRVIKTGDENAGKKAKCPDCGEVVQLPSARKAATSSKPGASKSKPKPSEDDEFEDLPLAEDSDDDDDELPSARPKRKKAGSVAKRGGEVDEESSSKKKKKGAKAQPQAQSKKTILIAGGIVGGVAFLGIIVGAVMFAMSGKPSNDTAAAPKLPELEKFSTDQGELTCLVPKGWTVKSGGGTGGVPPFATFEKGTIKIQFRSSPSGTQIGAIAQAGNQNPDELPDEMKPVSVAHAYQKEKFSLEVPGYEEKGEAKMFQPAGFGGEGRVSTFTATEGMVGTAYGYRATLLGNTNQWNVTCKCPAASWKACQPLFMKILESASGN